MLLHQLRMAKRRHKTHSEYQVWEEGSHPQQIATDEMMRQKLEYIHGNPVARGYVDDPTHWRMSSARIYEGLPAMIDVVTDWNS
jgi:putative transposase